MRVHAENLKSALRVAIDSQRAYEKSINYTQDSTLIFIWLEVLSAVNNGEQLEIQY